MLPTNSGRVEQLSKLDKEGQVRNVNNFGSLLQNRLLSYLLVIVFQYIEFHLGLLMLSCLVTVLLSGVLLLGRHCILGSLVTNQTTTRCPLPHPQDYDSEIM